LFEFFNGYSSFLIETARSDLSQPVAEASLDPLVSFGEQAEGSTALPGPHILNQDDLDLVYTKSLFLSSLVDA
jgi:hypothetical protein